MAQPETPKDFPPVAGGSDGADRVEDAVAVVRRLREAGHVAYFAGGCVRDGLLGLEPKDYDVATDAPPERVRHIFPRTQAVGAAFGVILVKQGRSQIEVATFRSDLAYVDGRRPEGVVFSTDKDDARRRDFTINGLFYDPIADRVIDYVGGQEDLKAKTLRAIGDANERFAEDHLRLLRAVRFAARFNLTIEPETNEAIAVHAPHLARISPERIAEELRVMLTPATRGRAWALLRSYKLDDVVFRFHPPAGPRVPAAGPPPASASPAILGEVSPNRPISFGLALAAAAVERGLGWSRAPAHWTESSVRILVKSLRQSLRISNDESEMVQGTLAGLALLLRDGAATVATLKRFLARPTATPSRQLLAALPPASARGREVLEVRLRELEQSDYAPAPFITGDDLTAAGFAPGPLFKKTLDTVYDAQLESHVSSKEKAMELALRIAGGEGAKDGRSGH